MEDASLAEDRQLPLSKVWNSAIRGGELLTPAYQLANRWLNKGVTSTAGLNILSGWRHCGSPV
ncbi:hypothetical protein [Citrobacter werkmanii]|uniref:hypothetical protein n=1 Tax=Citrobacter werkmanii TaxID=67827 RepID=UPI002656B5BE|nr:hypothetical protein [Citrobacter werkmanii]MDN8559097.1 hypothetical protein [Citrobacter werkmanii]